MKKTSLILLAILIVTQLANVTFADRGDQVYRDGVVGSVVWHAGVIVSPYNPYSKPIIQASGYGKTVDYVTYFEFKDYSQDKGVYRNYNAPDYGREYVASMAETLVHYYIPYSVASLMSLKSGTNLGQIWVYPADIGTLRCDGVVEYCNDYYGYNFQHADISSVAGAQSFQGVMPQDQARNLTQIAQKFGN